MSEATRRGCSGLLVSGGLALGAILLKEVLVPDALRLGLQEAGLGLAPRPEVSLGLPVEPPVRTGGNDPQRAVPVESDRVEPPGAASSAVPSTTVPSAAAHPSRTESSAPDPASRAASAETGPRVAPIEVNPIEAAAAGWVLQAEALDGLSCARLALVRGWVYARHGYVFPDARTRREFRKQPGYRPDHAVNPDTIDGHLSPADRENRALLLQLERRRGC